MLVGFHVGGFSCWWVVMMVGRHVASLFQWAVSDDSTAGGAEK